MALSVCYSEDKSVRESLYVFFKGNPLLQAFKVVEATINSSALLNDKVALLVNLLSQILSSNLLKTKNDQISVIFHFFLEHILKLILHGDWGKNLAMKQLLAATLKRLAIALERQTPTVVKIIHYLQDLLSDPWGNPTLKKILNEEDTIDGEALNIIKAEIGIVLVVRLNILIEAKCLDQALRLIEVCLKCVRDVENNMHFQPLDNEIVHFQDLYLILLVKTKKTTKVIEEVKKMGLSECLKMIQRCSTQIIQSNLQNSCIKMINFVTTTMVTTAMIEPISDESLLIEMIQEFFQVNSNIQLLSQPLRKFLAIALSSQHMYLLGQVFFNTFREAGQAMCIEIYVRSLTVNLNELEEYKTNNDFVGQDLSELHLYNGFLLLADCVHKDVFLHRECVLTAFSIKPSKSSFLILQAIAKETNNNEKDREICENLPSTPTQTDSNLNNFVNNILASPIYIPSAEDLGITQTLCDDLAIVIQNARSKQLYWTLSWDQLSEECELIMKQNSSNFGHSKQEL